MSSSIVTEKGRSKGEVEALEVAEESREQTWQYPSFVASLFMGETNLETIANYPMQDPEDRKKGDQLVEKLLEFFEKEYDADAVDLNAEIPEAALRRLAELGAFGVKIPEQFGGLGLSQTNYVRALATVAANCSSAAAALSAHQSIGAVSYTHLTLPTSG